MTGTEAVFEDLKHQIDRARDLGTSLQTLAGKRAFAIRPCMSGWTGRSKPPDWRR
jgi:hypothetical protein